MPYKISFLTEQIIFLTSEKDPETKTERAYCKCCLSFLQNAKSDIVLHSTRKKHIEKLKVQQQSDLHRENLSRFLANRTIRKQLSLK